MPPKLLIDLPVDVVQHILVRMMIAHHIGRTALTCKVVSVAARNAIRARQFSSEVARWAHLLGELRGGGARRQKRLTLKVQNGVENPGFDPGTSRMLSERSTN